VHCYPECVAEVSKRYKSTAAETKCKTCNVPEDVQHYLLVPATTTPAEPAKIVLPIQPERL